MPPTKLTIAPALRFVLTVPAERVAEQQFTPGTEFAPHIYAANWGVYLFKYLPLITPGRGAVALHFSHEAQIDRLVGEQAARWKRTHRLAHSRPILLARLEADSVAQRVRGLRQAGETAMK